MNRENVTRDPKMPFKVTLKSSKVPFILHTNSKHSEFQEYRRFHHAIFQVVFKKNKRGGGLGGGHDFLFFFFSSSPLVNQFTRSGHLVWTIRGLGVTEPLNPSGSSQIWTTIPGWSSVGG